MGRARDVSPVDLYHVVGRGAGKQIIFECDGDRVHFISLMKRFARKMHITVYAWCLMSNHFHMLVCAPLDRLAEYMDCLQSDYARYFNDEYGRTGHLFQSRYWSGAIEDESYLLASIRYIHLNPQKGGVAPYDEYHWSSYSEYLSAPDVSDFDLPLSIIGSKAAFRAFHRQASAPLSPALIRALPDEAAAAVSEALGHSVGTIKSLPRETRNELLLNIRTLGLGVRQIERITGVSRSVVSSVTSGQAMWGKTADSVSQDT